MKMAFSLDALSSSAQKAWRLKQDQQWLPCTFAQDVEANDLLITQKNAVKPWQGKRLKQSKQGMVISEKAGFFDFLMRGIFIHPTLHRFSPAPLPSKENIIHCIHTATANKAQLLHLNLAGQFQLLDIAKHNIIANLDIAVRGDIASSSEYLGATVKLESLDTLYLQFLSGWLEHLQKKRLGIFIPELRKTQPEDELMHDILNWQAQPLPSNS